MPDVSMADAAAARGEPDIARSPSSESGRDARPESAAGPLPSAAPLGDRADMHEGTIGDAEGFGEWDRKSGDRPQSGSEGPLPREVPRSRSRSRGRECSERICSPERSSTSGKPERFHIGSPRRSRSRSRSPLGDGLIRPVPDSPVLDEGAGVKRDATPDDATVKRRCVEDEDHMSDSPDIPREQLQQLHGEILDTTAGWDFTLLRHRDAVLRLAE